MCRLPRYAELVAAPQARKTIRKTTSPERPGGRFGRPKSTKNNVRSRSGPSGRFGALTKGVLERLGTPPGHPRTALGPPRERPRTPWERPGRPKRRPNGGRNACWRRLRTDLVPGSHSGTKNDRFFIDFRLQKRCPKRSEVNVERSSFFVAFRSLFARVAAEVRTT